MKKSRRYRSAVLAAVLLLALSAVPALAQYSGQSAAIAAAAMPPLTKVGQTSDPSPTDATLAEEDVPLGALPQTGVNLHVGSTFFAFALALALLAALLPLGMLRDWRKRAGQEN